MDAAPAAEHVDFGSLLRRLRLAAGFSQDALAERSRVSSNAIGALERGDRRVPQRETLELLARGLALGADARNAFERAAGHRFDGRERSGAADLPANLSSFVGREHELEMIASIVRSHRLVTITGVGGIGKTRVALEVAKNGVDAPVAFVELAPLRNDDDVPAGIAAALGVQEVRDRRTLDTLIAFLRTKRIALVLDNCEQVASGAASTADALLRACPSVRILATSRERLRLSGEHVVRLTSLALPSEVAASPLLLAEAREFAAIALFEERATAADRAFRLSESNVGPVTEICRLVEGIPLAIELAAARVTLLTLPALASELRRSIAFLDRGSRTAEARQQTMSGAIRWSYDMLPHDERAAFDRLGAFAGGFTLDTATAVAMPGAANDASFETFASLAEKSLIVRSVGGNGARFTLLEPFRAFAVERLIATGEETAARTAHAHAMLAVANYVDRNFETMPDADWLAIARSEYRNWLAALDWTLDERHAVDLGLRIAAATGYILQRFAPAEAQRRLRAARELDDGSRPLVSAQLDFAEGATRMALIDNPASLEFAQRAYERWRDAGDEFSAARAQALAGTALSVMGRSDEGEPALREALATARAAGPNRLTARVLNTLGNVHSSRAEYGLAREANAEALRLYEAIGAERDYVRAMSIGAITEHSAGDTENAVAMSFAGIARCRVLGDMAVVESLLESNLAGYLVALRRFEEARSHARVAVALTHQLQMRVRIAWAVQHLAEAILLDPAPGLRTYARLATRLVGFVRAVTSTPGYAAVNHAEEMDDVLGATRAALGRDDSDVALATGAALSDDEVVAEALSCRL